MQAAEAVPPVDPGAVPVVPRDADTDTAGGLDVQVGPALLRLRIRRVGRNNVVDGVPLAVRARAGRPQPVEGKDGHVVVGPFDREGLGIRVDLNAGGSRNVHGIR